MTQPTARTDFTRNLIEVHCHDVLTTPKPFTIPDWTEAAQAFPVHHQVRGWTNLIPNGPDVIEFWFCPDRIAALTAGVPLEGVFGVGGWQTGDGYIEAVMHIVDAELILWTDLMPANERWAAAEDILATDIGFDPMLMLFHTQAAALDAHIGLRDDVHPDIDWVEPEWFADDDDS